MELPTFLEPSVFVATWCKTQSHRMPILLLTDLRKNVVHGFARLCITLSEETQQPQDLDLQERIGDPGHVVFRTVSRGHQRLKVANKQRNSLLAFVKLIAQAQIAGFGHTFRNSFRHSGSAWHISAMRVVAASKFP